MNVDFWLDPGCPWCWLTSRWLVDIAPDRDLDINWKSISLLFKNDTQPDSPFYDITVRTRNLLRVMEAVGAAGHSDRLGDLYTAFGIRIHHRDDSDFDVAAVLGELGLDPSFVDALEDEMWDKHIRAAMEDGLGLVGKDVGTPIIAIPAEHGRVGLFGPVITDVPEHEAGLELWEGFLAMVNTPGFYELKRTRDVGPNLAQEPV